MLQVFTYQLLLTSLLLLPLACSSPSGLENSLRLEWEAWKSTHGKSYSHGTEEHRRSLVWGQNKRIIDSHNANTEGSTYTLAMNEFGDMVYKL